MPNKPLPPGGPPTQEFREAVHQLAQQAREEDEKAEADAKKRLERRPFNTFVRVGIALVIVQVLLFLYLSRKQSEVVKPATKPLPPPRTCNEVVYRTYWKIVAYLKDEGHPPSALDNMLGKQLDMLPSDPKTGKPLVYSTDGEHFELSCPK